MCEKTIIARLFPHKTNSRLKQSKINFLYKILFENTLIKKHLSIYKMCPLTNILLN